MIIVNRSFVEGITYSSVLLGGGGGALGVGKWFPEGGVESGEQYRALIVDK